MIRDENSQESEIARSLNATRKFVTVFWEHSLMDKETRRYREKFKEIVRNVFSGSGLSTADYVAVPVGGLRWAVSETSDFDAVVCYGKGAFKKINNYKYAELKTLYDFDEHQRTTFEVNEDNLMKGVDLLFTPDNYIEGNIEAARKIRLDMMELLRNMGGESYWRETVDKHFRRSFVWWDLNVFAPPGKEKEIAVGKRAMRISDRLNRRADKSTDPNEFKREFDLARRRITLPTFDVYYNGLKYSSGRLDIDHKYVQEGID